MNVKQIVSEAHRSRRRLKVPALIAILALLAVAGANTVHAASSPVQTVMLFVLATKAADGLDNPSAVAFGTRQGRTLLYITNAAYFSQTPRPSLMRLDVGVPGLRLP